MTRRKFKSGHIFYFFHSQVLSGGGCATYQSLLVENKKYNCQGFGNPWARSLFIGLVCPRPFRCRSAGLMVAGLFQSALGPFGIRWYQGCWLPLGVLGFRASNQVLPARAGKSSTCCPVRADLSICLSDGV
jgi:hypothetical protein